MLKQFYVFNFTFFLKAYILHFVFLVVYMHMWYHRYCIRWHVYSIYGGIN